MPPSGASHSKAGPDTADRSALCSQDPPRWPRPTFGRLTSAAAPENGIAARLAAPGSCARPSRAVPPGSVAELSCQKIVFDLQLADLPVQKIDLGFVDGSVRRSATLEDARRTVHQLLLPVVDLVRVDPESPRQIGDGAVALDCRQRHLSLEPCTVLLPGPLHVLLPRSPRFLRAGLHLSHLSHLRGPAQTPASAEVTITQLMKPTSFQVGR